MKFNNETLRIAVKEWLEDETKAEATYCHISNWDTSEVSDMSKLFLDAHTFNEPLNNWNTTNVLKIAQMFSGAKVFNQPIGNWDVSKVKSMRGMFYDAVSFNQDIGSWDVSKVTSMYKMFHGTTKFNQPIGNWNVGKVKSMNGMFSGAAAFNQPIGNWNVGKVTDMIYMFEGNKAFNQPIGDWNVGKVKSMIGMFSGAVVFNQPIGNWNVGKVKSMNSMFSAAESFNQPIGNWDVRDVSTDMHYMFYYAKSFCQNISTWSRKHYTLKMFVGARKFTKVYDRDSLKRKIPLSEAFPSIDSTLKKYISKLKKLFKSREYASIDAGIHLIKSLNENVLFEYFLNEVKIHKNGEFIRSKYFTGSSPAQPSLDYILLSLINTAPSKANIDKSLKPASIKRIFLEAEYPYQSAPLHHPDYWTRDCGLYSAHQLPDLAFENLEEITLDNYKNLESLKFLLNCKKLKKINIADLDNIKDTNIFIKGVVKKNDHYDNHNTITPRNK